MDNPNRVLNHSSSQVKGIDQFSWEKEGKRAGDAERVLQTEEAYRRAIDDKAKIDTSLGDKAFGEEYSVNQYQDKTGQSGGFAGMDMDRRAKVMRKTIGAQLFTQQEMVEAGYESGKKTAELLSDLKEKEVTFERYQVALDQAYKEAEVTGYLVDPIAAELIKQIELADARSNDDSLSTSERIKAKEIMNNANNAFKSFGVSRNGVKTLARINAENAQKHQEAMLALSKAQLKLNEDWIDWQKDNWDKDKPEIEEEEEVKPKKESWHSATYNQKAGKVDETDLMAIVHGTKASGRFR